MTRLPQRAKSEVHVSLAQSSAGLGKPANNTVDTLINDDHHFLSTAMYQ